MILENLSNKAGLTQLMHLAPGDLFLFEWPLLVSYLGPCIFLGTSSFRPQEHAFLLTSGSIVVSARSDEVVRIISHVTKTQG